VKTTLAAVALLFLGLISGVAVSVLDVAFEPRNCGEDCVNVALSSLFTWVGVGAISFPILGTLLWRRAGGSGQSLALVGAALTMVMLLPALALHAYRVLALGMTPTW